MDSNKVLFLVAALCLNLPPAVLGILGCLEWCRHFASWLAANAALSMTNAVAALYTIKEIRKAEVSENEIVLAASNVENSANRLSLDHSAVVTASTTDQGSPQVDNTQEEMQDSDEVQPVLQRKCCLCFVHTSHSKHLRHLVRYDCYVSTYCIFYIFWIFWLSDGVERFVHVDEVDAEAFEYCSGFHEDYVLYSFSIGFAYLAMTIGTVFMIHLPETTEDETEDKSMVDA